MKRLSDSYMYILPEMYIHVHCIYRSSPVFDVYTYLLFCRYCKCRCRRDTLPRHSIVHPITGRLRSLVRRIQGHIPRILMFGSGLESVPLVRSMLWEERSPYHPIGLYPGKDGVCVCVCVCASAWNFFSLDL